MRKLSLSAFLLAFFLVASAAFGQVGVGKPPAQTRHPLDISQFNAIANGPAANKHFATSRLSAATSAATKGAATQKPLTIRSVPTFTSSFTFQNQTFPFTMIGHRPQAGGTTKVDTSYLAISYFFDEFVDQNGNNIVIDAAGNTNN